MIFFLLWSKCLASLVEYRFGLNFGSRFYDYSGSGNHGLNGGGSSSNFVKSTDRGIFLNAGTSHVKLEKSFALVNKFCIVFWVMPLDFDGTLFYRGDSDYFSIGRISSGKKFTFKYKINTKTGSGVGEGNSFTQSNY